MVERELRKISRRSWDIRDEKAENARTDEIQAGCLQRMADTLEEIKKQGLDALGIRAKMLVLQEKIIEVNQAGWADKLKLIKENKDQADRIKALEILVKRLGENRDGLNRTINVQRDGAKHLYRRIASLKGVITRMKG